MTDAARCKDCGTLMKPLASSSFCPNDCDRVPELICDDDEITQPFIELFKDNEICPRCKSINIEAFDQGTEHCWNCGSVWSRP